MSKIGIGTVDYDYDRYKNRIRKFVVTKMIKEGRFYKPVWHQVEGFSPERGLNNINRDLSAKDN